MTKKDKGFALSDFLEPDDQETSKMKSLFNHEQEYSNYLGQIEYTIAKYYYYYGQRLTDKDVVSALQKINEDYDRNLKDFQKTLEKHIIFNLLDVLNDEPITRHEFELVIDYILWSIDNRSWLNDKQAFVKWTAYVFDLFSDEEKEKYENKLKDWLNALGLPDEYLDAMLLKGGTEPEIAEDESEKQLTESESQFFAMDDDEKIEFLIEDPYNRIRILQSYILDLADNEELEKLDKFYNRFIEKHDDFFIIHSIMGAIYMNYDIDAAESYLKKAKEKAEGDEGFPDDAKEEFMGDIDYLLDEINEMRKEDN